MPLSAVLALVLAACSAGAPAPAAVARASNGSSAGSSADSDVDGIGAAVALPAAEADALRRRCARLFERALVDNAAIDQLRRLVAAAPHRLAGSDGDAAAVRHVVAEMRALGLDDVRAQPVPVERWRRGVETAAVLAPRARPLNVTALGGSVPTAAAGVVAEVLEVRSFEQLQELSDAARGRIVLFNRPMPRALARTFRAYAAAVPQRTSGASEAARHGAVAVLVRSMTTAVDALPHTGALRYERDVPPIPAAAIATADADALAELCRRGPVTVRLRLGCGPAGEGSSANVIGELRGAELPDQVVVIGAHLDAWDLGHGAHDDGAGCAHVLEAMRLLQACGVRPRRTIRAVLFANEEHGLRGANTYAGELGGPDHFAAIESDTGGFSPLGFTCSLRGDAAVGLRARLAPLQAYGAGALLAGGGGGADIAPLADHGAVLLGLVTDSHRYFDYHHSAADTVDKVNERELALGAAALAYAASVLADQRP